MKAFFKTLSALLMCLLFCPFLMGQEKEEMILFAEGLDGWYSVTLPKESPADTLLCGVFFAEDEDARVFTLIDLYNRLKQKKNLYQSILNLEKEVENAAKEHYDSAAEAQMIQQGLELAQEQMYKLYGHPSDFDTQEWSETRMMTIKASIRKECGGGKLLNLSALREPRHGLAAAARRDAAGKLKWGFIDTTGRLVVPHLYDVVNDFNNRRYWSYSGFDRRPDQDYRPWTVVRKGNLIGMINKTGKVMVPIAFALYQDSETMIFHETPTGEFAAARDPKTKLHGIIDRKGNWVIQPKYEELAWDGDDNCFYSLTSRYDHGEWNGYDKKAIDLSR